MLAAMMHALMMAGIMAWEILWALILGFTLSAVIQAVVSKEEMSKLLPDDSPHAIVLACGLGAASSSDLSQSLFISVPAHASPSQRNSLSGPLVRPSNWSRRM